MRISDWSSDVCSSDLLHLGMVEAKHRGAIEGHIFDELDERALDGVETAIMVQMLRVDIGDDRDRPVEAQEAAVALVGLDHDPVAGAKPGIRTVIVDRSEEHTLNSSH